MKYKIRFPILVSLGAFPMSFISSFFSDGIAGLMGTIYAIPIIVSWIYWIENKPNERQYYNEKENDK